jgi:hypothetical protein
MEQQPVLQPSLQEKINICCPPFPATDDEIGKSKWQEILEQVKVRETQEYFSCISSFSN